MRMRIESSQYAAGMLRERRGASGALHSSKGYARGLAQRAQRSETAAGLFRRAATEGHARGGATTLVHLVMRGTALLPPGGERAGNFRDLFHTGARRSRALACAAGLPDGPTDRPLRALGSRAHYVSSAMRRRRQCGAVRRRRRVPIL